ASISWSNSVSTSPRRNGTLAIVRTPGPGGIRMQRSGDGLARAGGVLEPEAPGGTGILGHLGGGVGVEAVVAPVLGLLVLLVLLEVLLAGDGGRRQLLGLGDRHLSVGGPVAVGAALHHLGHQRGQRARERV